MTAAAPVAVSNDNLSYVNTAASYFYWQANDSTWDMYHNYTNAPGYRSTYREMHKLLQTAKSISAAQEAQISGVAGAASQPMRADLQEAARLLQGIRLDVSQWAVTTTATTENPALATKLDRMASTLNEMLGAVGLPPQQAAAIAPTPVAPPQGLPPQVVAPVPQVAQPQVVQPLAPQPALQP